MVMQRIKLGLERLIEKPPDSIAGKRLGLLANSASVDSALIHARQRIQDQFPNQLKALYAPQHGFFAEKQDNMIESDHRRDPGSDLPVFSLYGKTRIPTEKMLAPIDILLIDLQDAGTRVYTFIYTMSYCLEAAKHYSKQVIVLDRPNPIGGLQIEGNLLNEAWASFVGRYPIPMRHGLTIGELALFFNEQCGIGADLAVIPMTGWRRKDYYTDTGLFWVAPSPNLPTPVSAMVYPGQVIWEGTNLSEGRGTTQPFEIFGAPYLDPFKIKSNLDESHLEGVVLRPLEFEPTANKWCGQTCQGFQIHVIDRQCYRPYTTSLHLLQAVIASHPKDFFWQPPPYEYEYKRLPIDLILGEAQIRHRIEKGTMIAALEHDWTPQLEGFRDLSAQFHLYSS
jgi:uncharacterized protein YbbC (DUF1343 family)